MQELNSKIDVLGSKYIENYASMKKIILELESYFELSKNEGSKEKIKRTRKRNKLLAREKIELLLDKNKPFVELMSLAGLKHENGFGPGGTTSCILGFVSNKLCLINSNIGTKKGGVVDYATSLKNLRIGQIAEENKLTLINLVESGGANLPDQDKVFTNYGKMFYDMSRRSKKGIMTISIVFGNATAGGAYVPGMSDFTVMQKDQAKVFLAGPPLVKMATGEESSDEELGGAKMHSEISGFSDYLAEDEMDAIRICRNVVSHLNIVKRSNFELTTFNEPLYDPDGLLGLFSEDLKSQVDIREVIMRFVDGSQFEEFKPLYGSTMVCGWGNVFGYPVGILGNNGPIYPETAEKSASFIQLCNQTNTPLVFLHNVTGFLVGKEYERQGIIKKGSQLINTVSNSTVPHISFILGASYGAGTYAMSGKAYNNRFLFTWPTAKIAVMGPKQFAGVMSLVRRAKAKRKGEKFDEELDKQLVEFVEAAAEQESLALSASSMLTDDGIIDPRDTRNVLGFCLSVIDNNQVKGADGYGVFRL